MCCAAGVSMQVGLNALVARARPDRLLIEPTGIGHPKQIIKQLSQPPFDQLLDMADEAVSQGRLHESEQSLKRAEKIRPGDPVSQYLRAVICRERGDITGAVEVLQSILDGGYQGPYVYLTLGNLCEYHLCDCERAMFYLEKYLQYERNDEVEQRLIDLKAESAAE